MVIELRFIYLYHKQVARLVRFDLFTIRGLRMRGAHSLSREIRRSGADPHSTQPIIQEADARHMLPQWLRVRISCFSNYYLLY